MCVQIRSICGMLSDHGNAIQALIRRIDDGAGDTPTKLAAEVGSTVKDPAIDVNVEHNRRSRKSRTNSKACCPVRPAPAVTQKATKWKSKRSTIEHKGARNNPGKSRKKSPSLKVRISYHISRTLTCSSFSSCSSFVNLTAAFLVEKAELRSDR